MTNIVISSPLKGQWAILNSPGHPEKAYDFLAVNIKKNPYPAWLLMPHLFAYISVNSTFAWGQPVYSPFDGEVVEISDGEIDRKKLNLIKDLLFAFLKRPPSNATFNKLGGNYVILKNSRDGYFSLLAHFKSRSIVVKKGDVVTAGQTLGEVGNSGTSIQPHLHFQLMKTSEPFPHSENLLRFRLKEFTVKHDNNWVTKKLEHVKNGDHLNFQNA